MFQAYIDVIYKSPFDWFIALCGASLLFAHIYYIFAGSFDFARLRKRAEVLRGLCDLLPLLGLCGTILGLLNTLYAMDGQTGDHLTIVAQFAPALSTTVTAIIFLVVNIILNIFLEIRLKT